MDSAWYRLMNLSPPRPRWFDRRTPPHLFTLVLIVAVAAMTQNVFLPSLPAMAAGFDTSYAVVQLAVSLFLALSGAMQLVIGPLADRYGRRPVVLASLVVFVLATIGTLLAPTISSFLFFRMLQATTAAGFVLSRAIVRDVVPEVEVAAQLGYIAMGMALVPMVSPTIGGVLEQLFGWQASFVLLLVVGIGVLVIVWFDLGETAPIRHTSFAAQLSAYPSLFKSRLFWGYALSMATSMGVFYSFLAAAPAIGDVVYELSPAVIGYYFAAPSIGYLIGSFVSARLAMRLGLMRMMWIGGGVLWAGMGVLVLTQLGDGGQALWFFGMMGVVGIANGVLLPAATTGVMSVRPDLVGTASGVGGALMIGGGAVMAATAGVVVGDGSGTLAFAMLMLFSATLCLATVFYLMHLTRWSRR